MEYTVLIAEDDADIANILRLYLEGSGYRVIAAPDGVRAYALLEQEKVDLAILDIMMPEMDGFTLTRKIRESMNLPILILTSKIEDNDKILGLNLGADDYLAKPFNPLEVVARVGANLRRFYQLGGTPKQERTLLRSGELELDTEKMTLKRGGVPVVLTPTEFKLLAFLMKSPGRVYTKSQLCEALNGEFYENYENSIMVHISHLRDKIETQPKNPRYIVSVRGVGYKFENAR
jgi:DNA-binding response OmpR family regulator